MNFEVHLSNRANKFLKKADKDLYNRVMSRLESLAQDPFPLDAKKVLGQKEKVFRLRVGDYRVLYVVFLDRNAILVVDIDKRSRVYEQ